MNAAFIADMTDADIAEGIRLNDWMLTCPDVELPDAQRAFIREDTAALRAEQARRA